MTAVVYGVVWRYCQMEKKVCSASPETIASHIGTSAKTVKRHLKKLANKGYLKDLTPKLKHQPHTYADTGRAKIMGLVTTTVSGGTESPTSEEEGESAKQGTESNPGGTESPTSTGGAESPAPEVGQKVPPGGTESPTRWDTESNLGGTESPTKRVSKREKDTLEEMREPADAATPPLPDPSELTVEEIQALELISEQWRELLEREKRGKNRSTARKFIAAMLDQPPPAVLVYRSIVERFPKKALWPGIDRVVGRDESDLERWASVIKNWIACGWHEGNVSGMLDYQRRREIPNTNGGRRSSNNLDASVTAVEEFLEEERQKNGQ